MPAFCQVAVPVPLEGPFTYRVPARLDDAVAAGVRVLVPFGARKLTGIVLSLCDAPPESVKAEEIREVEQVLDGAPVLTEELLELGRWTAEYYLTPEGDVF